MTNPLAEGLASVWVGLKCRVWVGLKCSVCVELKCSGLMGSVGEQMAHCKKGLCA